MIIRLLGNIYFRFVLLCHHCIGLYCVYIVLHNKNHRALIIKDSRELLESLKNQKLD